MSSIQNHIAINVQISRRAGLVDADVAAGVNRNSRGAGVVVNARIQTDAQFIARNPLGLRCRGVNDDEIIISRRVDPGNRSKIADLCVGHDGLLVAVCLPVDFGIG